jgi:hypothetical protein
MEILMKRLIFLFFALLVIPFVSVRPQNSIQLLVMQDLNSLDLGSLLMTNDLSGQPRIFQLVIQTQPAGRQIYIAGKVNWQKDQSSPFQELVHFKTKPFSAHSLFNDEIGNSDIRIDNSDGDKNLGKDLAAKGKPTGIIEITISMFSESGIPLCDATTQRNTAFGKH